MDHVLARVKKQNQTPFSKLMSNHTLFDNIDISLDTCIEYSPNHNLDEDSWFKIENFSAQEYCLDILKKVFDSKEYNNLEKEKFCDISYLISIQSGNFYFQKITPSLFINRKFLAFGDVAKIEENNDRLIINTLPDAIYYKDADTIIFKNLSTITSIFKGIDSLYRIATNDEVTKFFAESFIQLTDDYSADKVSIPNRKRIGLALDTLNQMKSKDKIAMLHYINQYCSNTLKYDSKNNKVDIANDNDLKTVLYGIDQRFYTTDLSKEKRLANSIIRIE